MSRITLNELDQQTYDVVIIGAGAVGCATARELSGRGFRVLLLERADIASGTSSRSSRMLYSGLGYLAVRYPLWQMALRPLDIFQRLRYTSAIMQCRAELAIEMPEHLTKHRFHYPFRSQDRYPPWLVNLGFQTVEALGFWKIPLSYRRLTKSQAEYESSLVKDLNPEVNSVGVFNEYMYAWPERICVDTALDAEKRGATIRTYTEVQGIERLNEMWNIQLKENTPGCEGHATVQTKLVINSAGPWVDHVPGANGDKPRVLGVKGVNVMIRLPDKYKGQGLEAFSSKGEPFYVFPWRDYHFIGPTETVFKANPDTVQVEEHEIDYILNEMNILFPDLKLSKKDVHHCWCGVRPTSTVDGKNSVLPIRVSEHSSKKGIITVTGSTIMLHRHAARLLAKAVEKKLGKRNQAPIGLINGTRINLDEIESIIQNEYVVRLVDLMRRRLRDGLNPDLGFNRAEELSFSAAQILGWSEEQRQQELAFFKENTQAVYQKLPL